MNKPLYLIGAIVKLKGEFFRIRGFEREGESYKYYVQLATEKGKEDERGNQNFGLFSEEELRGMEG